MSKSHSDEGKAKSALVGEKARAAESKANRRGSNQKERNSESLWRGPRLEEDTTSKTSQGKRSKWFPLLVFKQRSEVRWLEAFASCIFSPYRKQSIDLSK
ncbi:MAG: hypothetical protein ACKVHP_03255 [Verrucomicrobiales bacterium]